MGSFDSQTLTHRRVLAHRLRALGGVLALIILAWVGRDALVAMLWGFGMILGAKHKAVAQMIRDFPPFPVSGASWSGACISGLLFACIGMMFSQKTLLCSPIWLGLGLAVNIAYLGAKGGCLIRGCCGGLRSVKYFRWFWSKESSLQSREIVLTLGVLLVGLVDRQAHWSSLAITVTLLWGHALVRLYSRVCQCPFDQARVRHIRIVGVGGSFLVSCMFLLWSRLPSTSLLAFRH
jgi:hypothetical protein